MAHQHDDQSVAELARPVPATDGTLAEGLDEFSRDVRNRSARQRERAAQARLEAAERRDALADARDVAALARDQAAYARDLAMDQGDADCAHEEGTLSHTGVEVLRRAAGQRRRAAQQRMSAADHRALAAEDRKRAEQDREQAALERRRALVDREMLARQIAIAEADATGEAADDDHRAGVRRAHRARRGSSDLLVRAGVDELLGVMSQVTPADARRRLADISRALVAPAGR